MTSRIPGRSTFTATGFSDARFTNVPLLVASARTQNAQLKAGILSYSRSKGAFAGLEIKGVLIDPDNDDNLAVYRKKANEILSPTQSWTMTQIPAGIRIFQRTLARYSVRR